jgi:hypothetical protein
LQCSKLSSAVASTNLASMVYIATTRRSEQNHRNLQLDHLRTRKQHLFSVDPQTTNVTPLQRLSSHHITKPTDNSLIETHRPVPPPSQARTTRFKVSTYIIPSSPKAQTFPCSPSARQPKRSRDLRLPHMRSHSSPHLISFVRDRVWLVYRSAAAPKYLCS